jgi:hypothetical protein
MAVDSTHPLYVEFSDDWELMDDTYRGERVVKAKGVQYLPATSGQQADGAGTVSGTGTSVSLGEQAYQAYKKRAHFSDVVKDGVKNAIGILHNKPPVIELPDQMEDLRDSASVEGESLNMLLRKINEAQLVAGRIGLLLDLPSDPQAPADVLPYIATYNARNIINWDNGRREDPVFQNLNLVVLNESEFERDTDFDWDLKKKFRVLVLGDVDDNEGEFTAGSYRQAVIREEEGGNLVESELVEPTIRGNTLDKIPFVFVNSKDLVPDPDDPPLIGLAQLSLAIYRADADLRQALFMQGQDTLVTIGAIGGDNKELRMGANARVDLPQGGDAKFIGVSSQGLPEMRSNLENDKRDANAKAGQITDSTSRQREGADALRIRVAAKTATLTEIALTGAEGLQTVLRMAALWIGADPEQVIVTPNLDFIDETVEGRTLVELMTAKSMGAPLSRESIHRYMRERDLTEMEFEDELAAMDEEEPLDGGRSPDLDPDQTPADDIEDPPADE